MDIKRGERSIKDTRVLALKHSRDERDERGIVEEPPKYVKWFSELSYANVNIAGGKGANLGEMYRNNFPVPPGFVIIAGAYKKFLEKTGLDAKIYEILGKLDAEKTEELEEESGKIRKMIEGQEMPKEMEDEIIESYEHLNVDEEALKKASSDALEILKKGREPPFVAVRSSATAEDSADASFAGQQSTFLNVKGRSNLIDAVKGCWASLFTARSVYYRVKKGFKHEGTYIAVVVQMMANSDKSGVVFTKDPVKNSSNVIIEAVFGLGEGIVSGMINPDHYEVSHDNQGKMEIVNPRISEKKIAIIRNSAGRNETVPLTEERSRQQVLTNYEIKRLAQYGLQLEEHYGKPQDIEFAIDAGRIYIVQTRPITTLGNIQDYEKKAKESELSGEVLLSGIAASPGVGSGVVKIIHEINELSKIKKGDILVTTMTNPDMVVAMQKANAIVTDEGGITAHASIVSREMGIACVVGTRTATTTLKDGDIITVDGFTGRVYKGKLEGKKVEIKPIIKGTRTHIKVIVDLPDYAERAALTKCDAVGLTRMEGIIAEGGKHPQYFLKNNKLDEYEELIYKGVKKIAGYFKEVWVRTSDIRSDEYEHLEGAPKWKEANPMLGMHGIRASLKNPELLKAELRALKRVAEEGTAVGVMMPQIISSEEVKQTKKYMYETGFHDNIKLGIMVETPAAVQVIEEMCDEGIKFISFGTNDLTQFTLALDRGNEDVQPLYNEMHPAILRQIAHVIKVCRARGVETSICGQAGSRKEMVKFLVEQGIDSISVNADAAGDVSEFVKELEGNISNNSQINSKEEKIDDDNEKFSGNEGANDNANNSGNEPEPNESSNNAEDALNEPDEPNEREELIEDNVAREEVNDDVDDNIRKNSDNKELDNDEVIDDNIKINDEEIASGKEESKVVEAQPIEDYSSYEGEAEDVVVESESKDTAEEVEDIAIKGDDTEEEAREPIAEDKGLIEEDKRDNTEENSNDIEDNGLLDNNEDGSNNKDDSMDEQNDKDNKAYELDIF